MFSSNIHVNFRQKLVVLIGFQLSAILLVNAYCAHERAEVLMENIKADEEAGISPELANKIASSLERDLERTPPGWDFDPCERRVLSPAQMEERKLSVQQIWFMEPADILRANMDQKWKDGKYLLFVDENKNVYAFDLTLPGYDTEEIKNQVRSLIND